MRVLQSEPRRPLDLLTVGDGGRVAAACGTIGVPGHVEVWDVTTGEVRHRPLVSAREARSLALTAGGRYLLIAEPTKTVVLDLAEPGAAYEHPGPPATLQYPELALSSDGRRLAVAEAFDTSSCLTWFEVGEPTSWQYPFPMFPQLWTLGPLRDAWFKLPAVSPDGERLAVVRRGRVPGGELVEVRGTTANDQILTRIPGSALTPVRQLAFSWDGSHLFVRRSGPLVWVYDAATGAPAGGFAHPGRASVTGLAVRPGDGLIAGCRDDGTVCLWHPTTLAPVNTLDWKLGKLVSVTFSPDGDIGAAGTEDGQVVVWDVDV